MDELDLKILGALRKDSRQSIRALAKSINESPSTVYNRVKRLENSNTIKRFTICYDFGQLNMGTVAFILIGLTNQNEFEPINPQSIRDKAIEISKLKGVVGAYLISGEFDLLIQMRSSSLKTIGEFVIDELRSKFYIEKTSTIACFETVLDEGETDIVPSALLLIR